MPRIRAVSTAAVLLAIVVISCTEQAEEQPATKVEQPVMREVSELVSLMFEMESDLKLIRAGLVEDSTYSRIKKMTYEALFTSESSKDVTVDSTFIVNGRAFLEQLHALAKTENRDTALFYFNNAVDACVTCHKGYCPGPVGRIRKLIIR